MEGDNDYVESARRKYLQAEKELNAETRRNLFHDSAKSYLSAAESLTELDDQARAALIFLATVALKRADNEHPQNMNENKKNHDISSYNDRSLAYSTIRTKLSGVKQVPKLIVSDKNSHVQDLFLLQSKLNEIGLSRGYPSSLSFTPSNEPIQSPSNLLASRHLSSPLGESFMLLNQSMHPKFKPPTANPTNLIKKQNQAEISSRATPIQPLRRTITNTNDSLKSNRNQISNNFDSPEGKAWAGMLQWGNILGFGSEAQTPQKPRQTADVPKHKDNIGNKSTPSIARTSSNSRTLFSADNLNESLYWNEQSTVLSSDRQSDTFTATNAIPLEDSKTLMEQIYRLQKTIKTLHDENMEMHEKLSSQAHISEQNKMFKKEMEDFKKEYNENYERLKRTLSDFAGAYPSPENPANIGAGVTIIRKPITSDREISLGQTSTTPKPITPIRTTPSLPAPPAGEGSDDTATTRSTSASDDSRIEKLEQTVHRLILSIEQKDVKIKKFEDYYARHRARAEEKRKQGGSDVRPGDSEPLDSPSNISSSKAAFLIQKKPISRDVQARHPSTSTFETSIQRSSLKNP